MPKLKVPGIPRIEHPPFQELMGLQPKSARRPVAIVRPKPAAEPLGESCHAEQNGFAFDDVFGESDDGGGEVKLVAVVAVRYRQCVFFFFFCFRAKVSTVLL